MPNTYNNETLSTVYNDDFSETDGYHKILFNSGRSLQARELNQLQTIIQEELTRFGKNIYKEGAAVSAGAIEIDNNYRFVRVTGTGVEDLAVGLELTGATTGVTAKILEVVELGSGDARLYIRYTGSGTVAVGTTEITFALTETISAAGFTGTVGSSSSDIGAGVRIIVDTGDFFAAGRFVHATKQSLIVSATSRVYTGTVGFKIVQDVITVNDTQALYDNTGGTPNVSAPGADRWRIRLVLVDKDQALQFNPTDDSFIFLCRVVNSQIVQQIDERDNFNVVNDMLAQRTYEESGNYIAEPFQLTFEDDDSTDSDIFAVVGPGLAYVKGFRVENEYPMKLKTPRPQAYETVPSDFVAVDYGAYVISKASAFKFNPLLQSENGERQVNLRNAVAYGGSTIGTAHIKAIEKETSTTFRVYLSNIEMTSGQDFDDVASIGTSASSVFDLKDVGRIYKNDKSTSLYPLPTIRPQSLENYEFTYTLGFTIVAGSSQLSSGTVLSGTDAFVNVDAWILTKISDGAIVSLTTGNITNNGQSFIIPSNAATVVNGDSYHVTAQVSRNNATRRIKTLTTATVSGGWSITEGVIYKDLGYYDVYELVSVTSDGTDITDLIQLDNGARDTHFETARVIKQGPFDTSGPTFSYTFTYWDWSNDEFDGGTGLYADAFSYAVDYTQVPKHKLSSGEIISLTDFVDFRGKKTATHIEARNPVEGVPIQVDASYYYSRADKLIVTEDGDFQILLGQQAREPLFKKTPNNSLELYKIVMNPNTLSPEDINTTFIEHKRYTMADIAKLERKLDNLEELYQLSFAELEAKLNPKLDPVSGEPKNETGLMIDDFTDHTGSDVNDDDFKASIDPENKVLRPMIDDNNIRLIYRPFDAADTSPNGPQYSSQNTIKKGDNVYINYTESAWVSQPLATESIAINTNGKVDYVGDITLSPSSDEWKSRAYGTRAVGGASRLSTNEAFLYNSHQWNWLGRGVESQEVGGSNFGGCGKSLGRKGNLERNKRNTSTGRFSGRGATGGHVQRVVSSESIRTVSGQNRVVDVAIVPWLRSRKIYFTAKGLKPNTTFIPFFDGKNVSTWCKSESFVRYADRTDASADLGNNGEQYSQHPDVPSALISDANGEVSGSFFIPSIRQSFIRTSNGLPRISSNVPVRFKAGKREFKLMDINVPDHNQAGSYAIGTYNASGMISTTNDNMTTTRHPRKLNMGKILRMGAGSIAGVNQKETKAYLDAIPSSSVNFIAPHVSGGWGGDFPGDINLGSIANMSTVLSDYIAVDQNSQAGTSSSPNSDVSLPFAQTFTIDNQFGVVLTKIDLYFEQNDGATGLPVSIEIVPMEGNVPGSNVVPGSTVTLNSSQVATSTTAATATTFAFDEPVYLNPKTTYALVVRTQSEAYKIWIAKSGDYAVGSQGKIVSSQAASGQLFLPSSKATKFSKELDLSFVMHRAVFETNASVVLRNAELPGNLLDKNPIVLNSGSAYVYVRHDCHGLNVGESVIISGVPVGSYGSLSEADLNGTKTVTAIDAAGFRFATSDPGIDANVGGTAVISSRNYNFVTCNPQLETIIPNKCSIDVTARFTTGKSNGGTETKFIKDTAYSRIVPDENNEFTAPRIIAQRIEETTQASIGASGSGGYSVDVKVDLKSSNDYVCPIVDLQRASLVMVQNCIDDENAVYLTGAGDGETNSKNTSGPSKHITAPLETVEPSKSLEVVVEAQVPKIANLDFYYRAALAGQNILDVSWTPVTPVLPVVKDNDKTAMRPIKIEALDIPAFTTSQVKTVFKSPSMAEVPQIGRIQHRTFLQ